LLRDELEFRGLVVTDALVMDAISQRWGAGEAARLAFAAGADLILMPGDADAAIAAIAAGLRDGTLPWSRLDQALDRRRQALARTQTFAADDAEDPDDLIDLELAEERELATTLVALSLEQRSPTAAQPLAAPGAGGVNLIRVDGVLPSTVLRANAPALTLPEQAGFHSLLCHPLGLSPWRPDQANDAPLALERLGEGPVLVQLFLRGNPFRGERDRSEPWGAALQQLQRLGRLAGLVVYGCPYTWERLSGQLDPATPAFYSPGQMDDAQALALERLLSPDRTGTDRDEGFTD
jgi:beta-glucosidase